MFAPHRSHQRMHRSPALAPQRAVGLHPSRAHSASSFDDGIQPQVVNSGETLVIPADLPHSAVALEDTIDFDIFAPPRQDWIDKDDSYLR